MKILAFETSCDETSVALVDDGIVRANVVASQIATHQEYGGVVPEIATRQHLVNLTPVMKEALREAELAPRDLGGVAATRGPGLPPALMIGFRAAQGMAFALGLPFIGIHHHEAHLYSPFAEGSPLRACFDGMPASISLIVSGGHTLLVYVERPLRHQVLGGTIDDAAGECFDKVAKLIGLPYPGGPEIDRLAREGDPSAYRFPRPLLKDRNDDFSFSGLKTAVRYFLEKHPELLNDGKAIRNLCASVQEAIVEVLVKKTIRAATRSGVSTVTASGGVSCNRGLRHALEKACREKGLSLRIAEPQLCTDNAGMVGLLAERYFAEGRGEAVNDDDVRPGWHLDQLGSRASSS